MIIRASQMKTLARSSLIPFVRRTAGEMAEDYPESAGELTREELEGRVRWGMKRAGKYGFHVEADLVTYISLMFAIGPGFDNYLPFNGALTDPARDAEKRLNAVLNAGDHHWIRARPIAAKIPWESVAIE